MDTPAKVCRMKHPKPAKTLTRPKIPVVPCRTIPSSDPVPRNLQHRQISEHQTSNKKATNEKKAARPKTSKTPKIGCLTISNKTPNWQLSLPRPMKRYRPPKHRRKHYDPQPSKRRANIYALTHARALYFYAALRVNSNYTRIQHGTPQRFQDLTAPTLPPPPANSGTHAGASSRAATIPCSAAPQFADRLLYGQTTVLEAARICA